MQTDKETTNQKPKCISLNATAFEPVSIQLSNSLIGCEILDLIPENKTYEEAMILDHIAGHLTDCPLPKAGSTLGSSQ